MPHLYMGGAEKQFRMFFLEQYERNKDAYIIALHSSPDEKTINFKNKYKSHVILHALSKSGRWFFLCSYFAIFWDVLKLRWKRQDKIIIYETYWLPMLPILKMLGYRVIYSERNSGHHNSKISYELIRKCDAITTNSLMAQTILREATSRNDVYVINNGVEIPSQSYYKKYKKGEELKILVPARITPEKNQCALVKAFAANKDINVFFAGNIIDQNYLEELQDLIKKSVNPQNFKILGFVENMDQLYRETHLVVLPSLEEGTSNVILECFAKRIPIIVSGIKQNLIMDRNKIFIFNALEPDSLKRSVLSFRDMPPLELDLELERSYNYVLNNYSVDLMVNSFNKL